MKICFILIVNIIIRYFLEHLNNILSRLTGGFVELRVNFLAEVCGVMIVDDSILVVSIQKICLGGTDINPAIFLHFLQFSNPEFKFFPGLFIIDCVADYGCLGSPAY